MPTVTLSNASSTAGFLDGDHLWGAAMNRNIRIFDALLMNRVLSLTTPGSASSGDMFISGSQLAIYATGDDITSGFIYVPAKKGWRVFVEDEDAFYQFDGSAWIEDTSGNSSSYATDIGDGGSSSFSVTHSLGTRDVHVSVYETASPFEEAECTIARSDTSTVTITFAAPPSAGEYRVYVSK